MRDKLEKLRQILQSMEKVAVAFSGGVDSSVVLKVAHDCLGDKAVALTAVSASMPAHEAAEAEEIARTIGASYVAMQTHETEDPRYLANSPDRCYFCKSDVYERFLSYARTEGYKYIVDGTNADDAGDHRPGIKAARERGVRSPLQEAGLTKDEIHRLARSLGLPNWDKPSSACLASRIPYGTTISPDILSQVERAELFLKNMGFHQVRVRHHGKIARIEVRRDDFEALIPEHERIVKELKALGYVYVTLDLGGFRSGSMNEVLGTGKEGPKDEE